MAEREVRVFAPTLTRFIAHVRLCLAKKAVWEAGLPQTIIFEPLVFKQVTPLGDPDREAHGSVLVISGGEKRFASDLSSFLRSSRNG